MTNEKLTMERFDDQVYFDLAKKAYDTKDSFGELDKTSIDIIEKHFYGSNKSFVVVVRNNSSKEFGSAFVIGIVHATVKMVNTFDMVEISSKCTIGEKDEMLSRQFKIINVFRDVEKNLVVLYLEKTIDSEITDFIVIIRGLYGSKKR